MRIIFTLLIVCMSLVTFPVTCLAVHSGIYKNLTSYQCEDYYDVIPSPILEQELYNYLGYKKYEVQIQRYIKSPSYLQKIRHYVAEKYPAPIYNQQAVWNMLNDEGGLIILQVLQIDLKERTAIVMQQSVWGAKTKTGVYTDDGSGTFPGESYIYLIDENPEYGQIANDSIAFLESIKGIYLDPEQRRVAEQKEEDRQKKVIRDEFLNCWTGKLTLLESNKKVKIYMDIPSFHSDTPRIYQGWIQFVPDKSLNWDFVESRVFFRVDYTNLFPLLEVRLDKNGIEVQSKISEESLWDLDNRQFVFAVSQKLKDVFKFN